MGVGDSIGRWASSTGVLVDSSSLSGRQRTRHLPAVVMAELSRSKWKDGWRGCSSSNMPPASEKRRRRFEACLKAQLHRRRAMLGLGNKHASPQACPGSTSRSAAGEEEAEVGKKYTDVLARIPLLALLQSLCLSLCVSLLLAFFLSPSLPLTNECASARVIGGGQIITNRAARRRRTR